MRLHLLIFQGGSTAINQPPAVEPMRCTCRRGDFCVHGQGVNEGHDSLIRQLIALG